MKAKRLRLNWRTQTLHVWPLPNKINRQLHTNSRYQIFFKKNDIFHTFGTDITQRDANWQRMDDTNRENHTFDASKERIKKKNFFLFALWHLSAPIDASRLLKIDFPFRLMECEKLHHEEFIFGKKYSQLINHRRRHHWCYFAMTSDVHPFLFDFFFFLLFLFDNNFVSESV